MQKAQEPENALNLNEVPQAEVELGLDLNQPPLNEDLDTVIINLV